MPFLAQELTEPGAISHITTPVKGKVRGRHQDEGLGKLKYGGTRGWEV